MIQPTLFVFDVCLISIEVHELQNWSRVKEMHHWQGLSQLCCTCRYHRKSKLDGSALHRPVKKMRMYQSYEIHGVWYSMIIIEAAHQKHPKLWYVSVVFYVIFFWINTYAILGVAASVCHYSSIPHSLHLQVFTICFKTSFCHFAIWKIIFSKNLPAELWLKVHCLIVVIVYHCIRYTGVTRSANNELTKIHAKLFFG